MGKILKELSGHSGSKIYLMEDLLHRYVLKIGNVDRNYERLTTLDKAGYPVPKVYDYVPGKSLEMEYLHGLDMRNYLIHNNPVSLYEFILDLIDSFELASGDYKDYTETYHNKLEWLPNDFLFTKEELIAKLPKVLPQSIYHGDLTLENILHIDSEFRLIDPVTIEYDSFMFDIAKLRQDLVCKWFIRNSDVRLDAKLLFINHQLEIDYPQACSNSMLILMLLRVLKHCKEGDNDYQFLMKEIERLWK